MTTASIETLPIEPYFDLELLMTTSQETRIGGDAMEGITAAWERWLPHAHACRLTVEGKTYLLVWLGDAVEEEVDAMWDTSPSEAFLYNALAQVMCMGMVHAVLPQVEEAGCAPAPRVSKALAGAVAEAGVPYGAEGEPGLSKRYAVVTHMPFKGGCEVCALRSACPKASGCASGPATVELPGY